MILSISFLNHMSRISFKFPFSLTPCKQASKQASKQAATGSMQIFTTVRSLHMCINFVLFGTVTIPFSHESQESHISGGIYSSGSSLGFSSLASNGEQGSACAFGIFWVISQSSSKPSSKIRYRRRFLL